MSFHTVSSHVPWVIEHERKSCRVTRHAVLSKQSCCVELCCFRLTPQMLHWFEELSSFFTFDIFYSSFSWSDERLKKKVQIFFSSKATPMSAFLITACLTGSQRYAHFFCLSNFGRLPSIFSLSHNCLKMGQHGGVLVLWSFSFGRIVACVIVAGCNCSPAEDKEPVVYLQLL